MFPAFFSGVLTGVAAVVIAVLVFKSLDWIFPERSAADLAATVVVTRKPAAVPLSPAVPAARTDAATWFKCPYCDSDLFLIDSEWVCDTCPLNLWPTGKPVESVASLDAWELPTLAEIDSGTWRPA